MVQSPSWEANWFLQLVKKFPAFHGTRRFITALKSVRHLSPSWASPIQSIYPHSTSWRSILILSTHLCLGLPSGLLSPARPYTPLSPHPYAPHGKQFHRTFKSLTAGLPEIQTLWSAYLCLLECRPTTDICCGNHFVWTFRVKQYSWSDCYCRWRKHDSSRHLWFLTPLTAPSECLLMTLPIRIRWAMSLRHNLATTQKS